MQSLPEVWDKGIEIDVFNGYTDGIVPVVSSPSFCLTDKQPIGSLVAGTLKALPFDKGFEQVNGMSVFVYEIVSEAAGNESKNVTCQMGDTHPWKNKKTLVVGDEVETLFSGLCFPVDERVTVKTRGRCFLRCIIIDKGKKKKGLGVNTSSIIRAIKKLEKNI